MHQSQKPESPCEASPKGQKVYEISPLLIMNIIILWCVLKNCIEKLQVILDCNKDFKDFKVWCMRFQQVADPLGPWL